MSELRRGGPGLSLVKVGGKFKEGCRLGWAMKSASSAVLALKSPHAKQVPMALYLAISFSISEKMSWDLWTGEL